MTEDRTGWHGGGRILPLDGVRPRLADTAFVAPGAVVIGDVEMAEGASLWFNCVARGDTALIRIGTGSNVQDGSILHADPGMPTLIGDDVLVGHAAIVHGCIIEDGGFVGMGAVVMNGAVIEREGMLAAGALLAPGKRVGARELWTGRPAKLARALTEADLADMRAGVATYRARARLYLAQSGAWSDGG